MTDREVLKKAIEIAIKNGYEEPFMFGMGSDFSLNKFQIFKLYFSHDFAKKFWGEELLFAGKPIKGLLEDPPGQVFKTKDLCQKAWRYHLQQMVLEPNPIDYLRKFIVQETKK